MKTIKTFLASLLNQHTANPLQRTGYRLAYTFIMGLILALLVFIMTQLGLSYEAIAIVILVLFIALIVLASRFGSK